MIRTLLDVATVTTKGARDCQEDAVVASFPHGQCFGFGVLADGVGGRGIGDLAGAVATAAMFSHLKMLEAKLDEGSIDPSSALRMAARRANAAIAEHVQRDAEKAGMAAMMLVPMIRGDRLFWFSIGNAALYLQRNGALRRINREHALSAELQLAMQGAGGRGQMQVSVPMIDGGEIVGAECTDTPILLKQGDVLIAATDGLETLGNDALAEVLADTASQHSTEIAAALLDAVEEERQPDQDNVSLIVIRMEAVRRPDEVIDLDDMPVLAQAKPVPAPAPAPAPVPVPAPAPVLEPLAAAEPAPVPEPVPAPEPVRDERKAYFYRGQKYYRD